MLTLHRFLRVDNPHSLKYHLLMETRRVSAVRYTARFHMLINSSGKNGEKNHRPEEQSDPLPNAYLFFFQVHN